MLFLLCCFILSCAGPSSSYRILAAFPLPVPSHHFIFRPILEELALRGHEILYVTSFPYRGQPPAGIEEMDLTHCLDYPTIFPEEIDINSYRYSTIPAMIVEMYEMGRDNARMVLPCDPLRSLIHSNESFDAVMFESFFSQEYLSAFVHKFNAVGIEVSSLGDNFWASEMSGLASNPSYQLDWKSETTNDMTFSQRLYNTYIYAYTLLSSYYYLHMWMQPIMDEYFNYTGWEGRPGIDLLTKNRSVVLVNAHQMVGYPFPTAPHVKTIGGINIQANKPLPEDMQKYLDESEHGVIYMSFGSNVNVSDKSNARIFESFMAAFQELPQNVLLKYESEYVIGSSQRVKTYQWMPQNDILAHKNVVLFITHGGYLSLMESLHHGVPLLGLPFFGDQVKNLVMAERSGFGKRLEYEKISKEYVLSSIREILSEKSYQEEAKKMSDILKDTRHSAVEEAVYWTEYAIRYPNALTPKSASMNALVLDLIDLKVFIVAVVFMFLRVTCRLFCKIFRASSRPSQTKIKEKQH